MAVTLGGFNSAYSGSASSLASGVISPQPTAGSTIIVAVGWQWNAVGSETVTSVTDNASGNTYTRIGTQVEDNTNGYRIVFYRAKNINTAASFQVTANMTTAESDLCVLAAEVKGCDTTDPNGVYVGQSQQNPGTGSNAVTTGSAGTPTEDGHLVFCATMSDTLPGMTVGTGYTYIGATPPASASMYAEYLVQSTATGVTGTWTTDDAAADFCTAVVSFKPLAAASTTLYFLDSTASSSNFGSIQFGGSAPSTATTATGWTVDTVGASNYALMTYGTERASSNFAGTALPNAAPNNTTADCFRSASTISGDWATGVWTIAVPVIAVSAASGQDGRVRVRLWRSTSATGASATEITSGAVTGTTVTDLATGAEQISTVTTSSITGFTMTNEYLFVQIAWEITGAAT